MKMFGLLATLSCVVGARAASTQVAQAGPRTLSAPQGAADETKDRAPVHQWKFDEGSGSNALESISGTKYPIFGTKAWTAGKAGLALVFDGASTVVNIKKLVSISDATYTVTVWIKPTKGNRFEDILARDRCFVSPYEWRLYLTAGNHLGFYEKDGSDRNGNLEPFETAATLRLNQWAHIALSRNHSDYKLYLNGHVVAQKTTTWPGIPNFVISQPDNPADMLIGARWNADGTTVRTEECFAGAMDDLRFYNQCLSAAQISGLAAAAAQPAGTDGQSHQ